MFLPQLVALDDPAQVAEGAAPPLWPRMTLLNEVCAVARDAALITDNNPLTPARNRLMVPPWRIQCRSRMATIHKTIASYSMTRSVMPAKAGIQVFFRRQTENRLDSRCHGNDGRGLGAGWISRCARNDSVLLLSPVIPNGVRDLVLIRMVRQCRVPIMSFSSAGYFLSSSAFNRSLTAFTAGNLSFHS